MPMRKKERGIKKGEFVCKECGQFCKSGLVVSPGELLGIMDSMNKGRKEPLHWSKYFRLSRRFLREFGGEEAPGALMFAVKSKGESSLFGELKKEDMEDVCLFHNQNTKQCELHGLKEHGIIIKPDTCRFFPFRMSGETEKMKVKGPEGRVEIEVEKNLEIYRDSGCHGVKDLDKETALSVEEDRLRKRHAYNGFVAEWSHEKYEEFREKGLEPEAAAEKTLDWIRKWYQKGRL